MSIASRINEIREHLTNTWDDIDSLGIGVKILPNEYTQVDYLESSGTQYIDTGVNADNKLSIKLEFGNLSLSKFIYQGAMAGDNSSNRVRHHMQLANDNSVVYWTGLHDTGCSTTIIIGTNYDSSKKYNLFADIYNQKYYLDNIEISGTFNSNDFDTEMNYYLFGRNTNNIVNSMGQIRIYSCKMYYENVLVRDFVPCYRNSDDEVGLYDLVNNVFYTNQGTGDFTYGSENIEYIDKNLENVDVTLKKLYGTISDKTDMSTNGIKGDTNQETITAETGTNVNAKSISISDVNTDKEHYFEIDGDTYQNSTTGTQLIGFDDVSETTKNGVTYSLTDDVFTLNGTANDNIRYIYANGFKLTDADNYTFKVDIISGSWTNGVIGLSFRTEAGSQGSQVLYEQVVYNSSSYSNTKAITSENISNIGAIGFFINNGSIFSNFKFRIILNKGDTASSYEPYTNGPSPNPDYPQNIEVVTGNQNVFISGKNIFNKTDYTTFGDTLARNGNATFTTEEDKIIITTGRNSSNSGVYIHPITNYVDNYIRNKEYVVSFDIKASQTLSFKYGIDQSFIITEIGTTTTRLSIKATLPSTTGFVFYSTQNRENDTIEISNIMVSLVDDTTYVQYLGSQTYPINLGDIELCKIDTYQDRIYKQNDKWYLEKNIDTVTLNGSETISLRSNTSTTHTKFILKNALPLESMTSTSLISDKFIANIGANSQPYSGDVICSNGTSGYKRYIYISISNDKASTVSEMASWLSTHNTIIYYALATPTTTEITDSTLVSQLNALDDSALYATTNINTTTSNLLPYIDLQYNVVTPAPSPERPSEVQNVSGDISYKITGKNKLNPVDFNTTEAVNGISALANQYYLQLSGTPTGTNRAIGTNLDITNIVKNLNTVTFSFSAISGEYPYSFRLYIRDTTSTIVERIDTATKTVTYTDGYTYTIAPFILSTATASEINCTLALQLEQGDTATTFEPYLEKTYPVSLGDIELCKINTYQDRIYSDNGKIYLEKNINKVVLDGTESWRGGSQGTTSTDFRYMYTTNSQSISTSIANIKCNYLKVDIIYASTQTNASVIGTSTETTNNIRVLIDKTLIGNPTSSAEALTNWTNWLSTHNTIIYYALANPTTTEITPTNYPILYNQLKDILDYLTQYKINNEFILGYDSPEIEY